MKDSSEDEDDIYTSPPKANAKSIPPKENIPTIMENSVLTPPEQILTPDAMMKDPPDDKNTGETTPLQSNPSSEINTIYLELTDMYLNSLPLVKMKDILCVHYKEKGPSISREIINVYFKKYLFKTIQELQEKMRPKASNLKLPNYTQSVQANLKLQTQKS